MLHGYGYVANGACGDELALVRRVLERGSANKVLNDLLVQECCMGVVRVSSPARGSLHGVATNCAAIGEVTGGPPQGTRRVCAQGRPMPRSKCSAELRDLERARARVAHTMAALRLEGSKKKNKKRLVQGADVVRARRARTAPWKLGCA